MHAHAPKQVGWLDRISSINWILGKPTFKKNTIQLRNWYSRAGLSLFLGAERALRLTVERRSQRVQVLLAA